MDGLIYVGNWRENFEQEASELGTSHRVPILSLGRFSWGDRIYLARYEAGITTVFGYFHIRKLSILNPELFKIIKSNFEPLGRIKNCKELSIDVDRSCGSYTETMACTATLSLNDLIRTIYQVAKLLQVNPMVLVGGTFIKLIEPIVTEELKFTRTLREWPFPKVEDGIGAPIGRELVCVKNYRQKGLPPVPQKLKQRTIWDFK